MTRTTILTSAILFALPTPALAEWKPSKEPRAVSLDLFSGPQDADGDGKCDRSHTFVLEDGCAGYFTRDAKQNYRTVKRSLMLSADQLQLTARDVADLVAFLKSHEQIRSGTRRVLDPCP